MMVWVVAKVKASSRSCSRAIQVVASVRSDCNRVAGRCALYGSSIWDGTTLSASVGVLVVVVSIWADRATLCGAVAIARAVGVGVPAPFIIVRFGVATVWVGRTTVAFRVRWLQ